MPTTFRPRPSRRRERGLTAKALVLGFPASDIRHGDRRAILVPFRPERDAEDRPLPHPHFWKRFAVGQLLAVKEYVPGPTAMNVRLVFVHGPWGDGSGSKASFTLGQVDARIARELGHYRQDAFWRSWIVNHDQDWYVRRLTESGAFEADDTSTLSDEEIEARFKATWTDTPVWLLRFDIEIGQEPIRLLARGGGASDFKAGEDNRWYCAPRTEDEERESDRGYTAALSLAADDLPGLSDSDWDKHIGPKSRYREQDRLATQRADRAAKSVEQRYEAARVVAKAKGYKIRDESRRYERLVAQGLDDKARRQLELIEQRVFPAAA